MAFFSKMKWILGILLVFVLIVTTNLIDRNNFVRVRDSVVTIYEDRLIAKNIIYDIAKGVQEKEVAALTTDTVFYSERKSEVDRDMVSLIAGFEQTKLTPKESDIFNELKANLNKLSEAEKSMAELGFQQKGEVENLLTDIKQNLDELSDIQIEEGNRQMAISKRAIDTVELFTQLEIYLLVFLAIVIQVIILYQPRDKTK